jgi:hypothetical protein
MPSFFLFLFTLLTAIELLQAQYNPQEYPWIEAQAWRCVDPYLLPDDEPAKNKLDKIFGKKRATASVEAMEKAGFQIIPMRNKRKVIAKHPALKGYLIKTYLDCHRIGSEDWKIWKHRAVGARRVQACLDQYGFNDIMKVPHKWLYPLPLGSQVDLGSSEERRDFILVVEDMKPLQSSKNKKQFKKMTTEQLEALFIVLKENLLHDSIYIHNIPFCKDGRMAFLDLEHHSSTSRRVRFERLTPYFSSQMQPYWQELVHKGVP